MNFDPIHGDFNTEGHKAFSPMRELSFLQSSLCRSGNVVTMDEARKYAAEQAPSEPIMNYADRRGV